MAIVRVTDYEVQKVVDEVLNTNDWSIAKSDGDPGLEEAEYFAFVRAVLRKLGNFKHTD